MVFALLAAFTILTFLYITRLARANAEIRFLQAASDRVAAVQRQFEFSIAAVDDVGTLFDTRPGVTEAEFQRFVDPILKRNPALTALGYAPLIHAAERAEFERESAVDYPAFQITERLVQGEMVRAADRQIYAPLRYLVPIAGNEAAFGFDLMSDAMRNRAMTAARDLDEVRATAPVVLVQERSVGLSLLLARPIYRPGRPLNSAAEREIALSGWVSAVVRTGPMIQSALAPLQPSGVDFSIYDVSDWQEPAFLVEHLSRKRGTAGERQPSTRPEWFKSAGFEMAGRSYRVELSSAPTEFHARAGPAGWGLLLAGLAFSLAMAALVKTIQSSEIQQQRSSDALRVLSHRLINVQEHERARLAREIHDEIGQAITAVKLNLHALDSAGDVDSRRNILNDSNSILDRVLNQVRDITLDLRPPMLDDIGLNATLAWYLKRQVARSQLKLTYTFDEHVGRLPGNLETSVFRIVQEATTNVLRHAHASALNVAVKKNHEELEIVIADDGVGLIAEARDASHAGSLRGLRQRVGLAGGSLSIDSAPGQGTRLVVRFSPDAHAADEKAP